MTKKEKLRDNQTSKLFNKQMMVVTVLQSKASANDSNINEIMSISFAYSFPKHKLY